MNYRPLLLLLCLGIGWPGAVFGTDDLTPTNSPDAIAQKQCEEEGRALGPLGVVAVATGLCDDAKAGVRPDWLRFVDAVKNIPESQSRSLAYLTIVGECAGDLQCMTVRLRLETDRQPMPQETYNTLARTSCSGEGDAKVDIDCILAAVKSKRDSNLLPSVGTSDTPHVSGTRVRQDSDIVAECASGFIGANPSQPCVDIRTEAKQNNAPVTQDEYDQAERRCSNKNADCIRDALKKTTGNGLRLDALMRSPEPNQKPARSAYDPDLDIDNVHAARSTINTDQARQQVVNKNAEMEEACSCVTTQTACFSAPSFGSLASASELSDTVAQHQRRIGFYCSNWTKTIASVNRDDLQDLQDAQAVADESLSEIARMHRDVQERIERAQEEQRRARLEAQKPKKTGLAAALATMVVGTAISDVMELPLDTDRLAEISVGVGRSRANGDGIGKAVAGSMEGMVGMLQAQGEVKQQQQAEAQQRASMFEEAMSQVRTFPAPGEQPAAQAATPSPQATAPADPFAAMLPSHGALSANASSASSEVDHDTCTVAGRFIHYSKTKGLICSDGSRPTFSPTGFWNRMKCSGQQTSTTVTQPCGPDVMAQADQDSLQYMPADAREAYSCAFEAKEKFGQYSDEFIAADRECFRR